MDEDGILLFNNLITERIKENQTLLRKKGLLKTLLKSLPIRELIEGVKELEEEEAGFTLTDTEKKLIDILVEGKWNLDTAIEKIIDDAATNLRKS